LVVLALLMLMHGGLSLIGALTNLRDPKLLATVSLGNATETPEQMVVKQKLLTITQGILLGHHEAIRAVTLAAIALALVTLYAVAAILSRDKHGRRLALVTAWLIIAYQLGSLPVFLRIARDHATQSAPLLAEIIGGTTSAEERLQLVQKITSLTVIEPYVVSAFGVGWALLLMAYFGGRRGRQLYGIEPVRTPG
jgi:hypothetical protein